MNTIMNTTQLYKWTFMLALVLGTLFLSASRGYCEENQSPVAILTAEPEYVLVDGSVTLDGSDSYDPDGSIVKYEWDWTDNGSYDYYETSSYYPDGAFDGITTHAYSSAGTYTAKLRVTDDDDATDTDTFTVYVGRVFNVTDGLSYNDIQSAINAASANDVIKVYPGRYIENINFTSAKITLTSIDANNPEVIASTIIDGNDANSVIRFDSGDANSVITGFTITNGYGGVAGVGGGIYCNSVSPTITNCIFSENSAVYGAGMWNESESGTCNPIVRDCVFTNNTARNGGGGMANITSSPTVINCSFNRNNITTHNFFGGGMFNCDNSSPVVVNCTFSRNCSPHGGGGMGNFESSPMVINCIFTENTTEANNPGGMSNIYWSDPNITNCIFWGNDGNEIGKDTICNPVVTFSDVEGGYEGVGNIDSDPCFVDADANDFHLSSNSPCINAGDPNGDYDGQVDMDGEPRVMGDCNEIVDMGADEVYFPSCWNCLTQCHADSDGDGDVDLADFYVFKAAFGTDYWNDWNNGAGPYSPCADYDREGDVDLADFQIFDEYFGEPNVPADCNCGGVWPPE